MTFFKMTMCDLILSWLELRHNFGGKNLIHVFIFMLHMKIYCSSH